MPKPTRNHTGRAAVAVLALLALGATRAPAEPLTPHPADTNGNWRLTIAEVTAYAAAWRQGRTWSQPPNPIPIAYVTNAAALWKRGELYVYDGTVNPPYATPDLPPPPKRKQGAADRQTEARRAR